MKITFWSNETESGVTSNIAAIGTMMTCLYPGRVALIENHTNERSLGRALLGNAYCSFMLGNEVLSSEGREHAISIARRRFGKRISEEGLMEITENGLFYFMQNPFVLSVMTEFDINIQMLKIVNSIEQKNELLFIDAKGTDYFNSKLLMDSSDIIVVNLKQDENAIRSFFTHYRAILYKCVFVVGKYTDKPWLSKKEIAIKYRIAENKIAAIPYCEKFNEAMSEGGAADFISDNVKCRLQNKNYPFIKEVKSAANMLMKNVFVAQRYMGARVSYL